MRPEATTSRNKQPLKFLNLMDLTDKKIEDLSMSERTLEKISQKQQTDLQGKVVVKLREKLNRNDLAICFEPIVFSHTQRLTGANVTIKIRRKGVGLVPAQHIFSIVEHSNVLVDIGCWLVKEILYLSREFPPYFAFTLPANFYQLQSRKFVYCICNLLDHLGIDGRRLQLVFAGNDFQKYEDHISGSLQVLGEAGVTFCISQFGRIEATLQSLSQKGFSSLVLDRSLTNGLEDNEVKQHFMRILINEGHAYNFKLRATGVDSIAKEKSYAQIGIDELQKDFVSVDVLRHMCLRVGDRWQNHPVQSL